VGLTVPATLITNDPARAKEFFKQYRGAVVTKLIRHPPESLARAGQSMHKSQVNASDLEDSNAFRHCPALFQERIEKGRDLRAIFVNGHFFVGAIDPGGSSATQLDWRRADPSQCRWKKDELPDRISRQLTALMGDLGLLYGAIDLIRTPDDRYLFLEVNAGGEWGMLERDLGYPISTALAAALVD
jgi:glutathione synthase/RimK-type ligase-like ATP-grasp enzyme